MEEIYNLELEESTLKSMMEIFPGIKDLTNEEVREKIIILQKIGCTDNQIKNIIGSNAMYLDRLNTDIIKLINYLTSKGFSTLNILFDSNPYILNLDSFEIENYINERLKNEQLEDIVDELEANTELFNEM